MQLLTVELLHWESAKYANILLIQEVISAADEAIFVNSDSIFVLLQLQHLRVELILSTPTVKVWKYSQSLSVSGLVIYKLSNNVALETATYKLSGGGLNGCSPLRSSSKRR